MEVHINGKRCSEVENFSLCVSQRKNDDPFPSFFTEDITGAFTLNIRLNRRLKKKLFGTRKSRKRLLKSMLNEDAEDFEKLYTGYFDSLYDIKES